MCTKNFVILNLANAYKHVDRINLAVVMKNGYYLCCNQFNFILAMKNADIFFRRKKIMIILNA